ncbi:MAG: glycosyltransferase family 2 protein [Phycisphaeraceae bacterium]|nr:glycosyltransferase family 2 protein [Phycisphaeraceae bacterium]
MNNPSASTFSWQNPELSVVVPALNEQDNVQALVAQIQHDLVAQGLVIELIVVDDGSTDDTLPRLLQLAAQYPWVRLLHRAKPQGQSAAMHAGIAAARGRYVATLDADLQNDPADLPGMLEILRDGQADFVQGDRSANRRDTLVRKVSSWVGRRTRRLILNDPIRDTACSARVVRTELARQFPLIFKGMHRFLPVYARLLGAKVVERPVHHRPRTAGTAKYGILNRGLPGLIDCLAVRWMIRRYRNPAVEPAKEKTL